MSVGGLFDCTDYCMRVLRQSMDSIDGSELKYLGMASIECEYQICLKRCLDRGLDENI